MSELEKVVQSADFIVTVGSQIVRFLELSSIPFITLAAVGAQEPFSIKPTILF